MYNLILIAHILAGTAALISGSFVMAIQKGTKKHKLFGNAFFVSMVVVSVSSLLLCLLKHNSFLLAIGVFTFYLNTSGKLVLTAKTASSKNMHYAVEVIGILGAILLLIQAINHKDGGFTMVLLTFFGIQSFLIYKNLTMYLSKTINFEKIIKNHSGRMAGCFIAAITAFCVVNYKGNNGWIFWLLPTVLIVPINIRLTKKFLFKKVKPVAALVAVLSIFIVKSVAQPYIVKNGNTRHRFAQFEFGVTQYISPQSGKTQLIDNGNIANRQLGTTGTTAIYIGATHFWGHMDLALTIPLIKQGQGMRYGVDLQAKVYPKRIENKKLVPYFGISMNPFGYKQNDGPTYTSTEFPLLAGLNYTKYPHQFEMGLVYNYNKKFKYAIDRTTFGEASFQPVIGFTYKYTLETTGGLEKSWRNGTTKERTKKLADLGKLNNFSINAGITSSFRTVKSSYLQKQYNFAEQHSYNTSYDVGVGYYWHKPDLNFNVALRNFKSAVSAYGFEQKVDRNVVSIELTKALGDYHGFVPFIGLNLGYENIRVEQKDNNIAMPNNSFKGLKPGLTFGWDIRPDRIQPWLLRTSLRYMPNLTVDMGNGLKSNFDQLEFNFIQLVVYPGRFKNK